MAMSDNLVRNKMLEVERERLNVEIQKTKVLMDIRDVMLMMNGMMGLEVEDVNIHIASVVLPGNK